MIKGKKLLVIGGASQHVKVVEAAQRLGATVYVVDYLEDSLAKRMADKSYVIDVYAVDKIVELCKEEKIDGAIVTSLEACVLPYYKVCKAMGYPCFGNEEQYRILTNKHLFKECCAKYGVDTIPAYSVDDIINSRNVEYPIFVKPVDSRGSRGQAICYNREEAIAAIEYAKTESASGIILIEKYMKGYPDFTAAYLILNGEPILVRTGDRFEGDVGSGLENLCIASCSPSKFTGEYLEKVHPNVVNMLKGMGLENAPVFFQGFIDGDTVRFYDPGLRFAGGEYERLMRHATGIDIMEILVRVALGEKPEDVQIDNSICEMNGMCSIQLDPTLRPGKIAEIKGIDEIANNPSVVFVSQRYFAGDVVPESNDLRRRFAEFAILSNDIQHEIANIRFVQKKLKVMDAGGNDMVINPFDTTYLKG